MKTYIFGHLKPDTDSVVAAMALEFFYKKKNFFDAQNPEARIVGEINRLLKQGYLPIMAFQHFELCEYPPQSSQRIDFKNMAEAGAVIVSGSQAHCPQAVTFVDGNFVHYGLGNLFFDQMESTYARSEFLDRHVFYGGKYISTELLTAILEDYARPRAMTGEERAYLLGKVFEASEW